MTSLMAATGRRSLGQRMRSLVCLATFFSVRPGSRRGFASVQSVIDRAVCSIQGSEATKPGEHVGPPGHVSGQIVGRVEWSARSRATSAGVYGTDFSSNSLQPPSR